MAGKCSSRLSLTYTNSAASVGNHNLMGPTLYKTLSNDRLLKDTEAAADRGAELYQLTHSPCHHAAKEQSDMGLGHSKLIFQWAWGETGPLLLQLEPA